MVPTLHIVEVVAEQEMAFAVDELVLPSEEEAPFEAQEDRVRVGRESLTSARLRLRNPKIHGRHRLKFLVMGGISQTKEDQYRLTLPGKS